ncbi:MAG: GNAT family N-acetyltransferase [Clostridiales bacterium]|nr:GNAT family N-acetyltransferase [Clostridiales bacterium]
METRQITDSKEKEQIAKRILTALPDWFAIPESTAEYIRESQSMPFWTAFAKDEAVGFLALKETSKHAAEIYVAGVLPAHHRKGIGRQLFHAFKAYAAAHGYQFLQVKTVRRGCCDEYDRTCAFYESLGFVALECFPTLWDESNPCQLYIMSIK